MFSSVIFLQLYTNNNTEDFVMLVQQMIVHGFILNPV